MKKEKTIAIVPGSFDPITYGHINIAKRAAKMYDKVYLAVMINTAKDYMFSIDERKNIAKTALEDTKNIEVISSTGMLWMLAEELGAVAIVKGYRNKIDYDYEMNMASYNEKHYPNAKTVLLQADEDLSWLSSTIVKEKIRNGDTIDDCLPPKAVKLLKDISHKFS